MGREPSLYGGERKKASATMPQYLHGKKIGLGGKAVQARVGRRMPPGLLHVSVGKRCFKGKRR